MPVGFIITSSALRVAINGVSHQNVFVVALMRWGEGVNQAYSRLSTTHAHITDCNLDLVVYAGVCV